MAAWPPEGNQQPNPGETLQIAWLKSPHMSLVHLTKWAEWGNRRLRGNTWARYGLVQVFTWSSQPRTPRGPRVGSAPVGVEPVGCPEAQRWVVLERPGALVAAETHGPVGSGTRSHNRTQPRCSPVRVRQSNWLPLHMALLSDLNVPGA